MIHKFNSFHFLNFITSFVVVVALVNCSTENSSQREQNPDEVEGSSSGGGGFGDESSNILLKSARDSLASMIRRSHRQVFSDLPKGWSQERLAKLIENVKSEPNMVLFRYNRELMFNYAIPKTGEPYLVATSLFFRAHASIPINTLRITEIEPYLSEIRLKLMHEAAHVLGVGTSEKSDYKARTFATMFFEEVIWKNNIYCSTPNAPAEYPLSETENLTEEDYRNRVWDEIRGKKSPPSTFSPPRDVHWYFNRPTGFDVTWRNSTTLLASDDSISSLAQDLVDEVELWRKDFREFLSGLRPDLTSLHKSLTWTITDETWPIVQQYFGESEPRQSGKSIAFRAHDLQNQYGNDPFEEIVIPRVTPVYSPSDGGVSSDERVEYDGVINFTYGSPKETMRSHEPAKIQSFPVRCSETLRVLGPFQEFMGEKKFTDPLLLKLSNPKTSKPPKEYDFPIFELPEVPSVRRSVKYV